MESINFLKMNGSGNDFILIDNREGQIKEEDMSLLVKLACRRRTSVGADGLIFVVKSRQYDFGWRFFNADGNEVEMCGNGGRCVSRFAFLKGIAGRKMTFETIAGPIKAEIHGRMVKILMPKPTDLQMEIDMEKRPGWQSVDFINTGVPHVVVRVKGLDRHPVKDEGRLIRYHSLFLPLGTNANFMQVIDKHKLLVRTYERGVEDETLACGTGAIASVLVNAIRGVLESPVIVETRGGDNLTICFSLEENFFKQIWLEGNTSISYEAQLHIEAL